MYKIEFLKEAIEDFKKLDKSIQIKIKSKLDLLSKDPNLLKNSIKPLKGEYSGLYRLRVGDYRIIFEISEISKSIIIFKIGHRKDIY